MFIFPPFLRAVVLAELMRCHANARDPDEVIPTRDGRPYLRRWHITPRGQGPAVYLHHFLASDDDRAQHDHPWPSLGMLLLGNYYEHTPLDHEPVFRATGDVIFRAPEHTHRVELERDTLTGQELEVWTLFMVGPRVRPWGFHCPQGWVPWQEFTQPGEDGRSVGCGA
ncbi:hypothetical protein EOD42_02890 [Rhodovarius crocodyli]|uniref:Cupin domain-containing protein n=1 Tax=Rhodovarius crocodyli TaxID=1979269 RepID=A0A437MN53_9PROT|nr:hypothetical protein [Rhodovarius crocodyli]RVT99069.1 hypothetical protein EOD42_02890 [Rhodovarius crocodyli]